MSLDLAGRPFLVIGAGRTGLSTARFLVDARARVRLVEHSATAARRAKVPAGVEFCIGDEEERWLDDVEVVVPSPGVARSHTLLRRAMSLGVSIVSEIELAARFLPCPILAVTGTNGKSTTTTLLGAMLRAAGQHTFIGGNLGTPLIEALDQPYDAAVAEVSSFQLEWVDQFRPSVAVMLNLTPDHLDRYASVDEYGAAKARLLAAQQAGDTAVLNRDDPWVWEQRRRTRATTISFGRDRVEFGAFIEGDTIVYRGAESAPYRLSLARVHLSGAHNRENMMAAATAAAAWGVPQAAIQQALDDTHGLPHRLELVREKAGVRFFDDSKGTNVGAMEKSVASFEHDVILLAGGYDKGGDFRTLESLLPGRVKHLVLFGAAAGRIESQLSDVVAHSVVPGLSDAVRAAAAMAVAGDTVLLSPGCASFDEFTDYVARGRKFRELVEAL